MRTPARSKKLLLLPLIPALALGAIEVVAKINVARDMVSTTRGDGPCIDCPVAA